MGFDDANVADANVADEDAVGDEGAAAQVGSTGDADFDRLVVDARPDGDTLTRAVLRARVTLALFGEAEPLTVGRYRLGLQVGRGGGGSVFVAADPDLRRDVAVKLVRCTSDRHRERALAEGRALAKLSHPNVVPVHDVGETGEYVYLVMELLRGASLREITDRPMREIIAAYRQAAAGLAAAHAVGLIHRDFKPDNAVFGDDGRLRVVDFGLATDIDSGDAAAVGTPRYMAPEQRAGQPADAAVDQFALGIALREAIASCGRREPVWLGRVLARATAERPGDRYPSMAALGAALADDPRSRWKKRLLIGVPIAVAVAGFGIGRSATSSRPEACTGGPEALAPTWSPARSEEIVRHVERLGTPFAAATAPLVRDKLDKLGSAWIGAHKRGCIAHERGELPDELYDRATVCLARARIGLGESVGLLAATTAEQLDKAVGSLAAVAGADRCADPAALAAEAKPQPTLAMRAIDQQIEIAAVHARASTENAVRIAQSAASSARASGDKPLLARALLVLGHAYLAGLDFDPAIETLDEAMRLAVEAGLDDVGLEAYARRAYVFAQQRPKERPRSLEGLALARALGVRAGERGAFARALLSNSVGVVAMLDRDFAGAREGFERAVEEANAVHGPGASELVIAVSNLALLTVDAARRHELYERATASVVAAVGPDHPQSLEKRFYAITDGSDAATAVTELTALCRRLVALHPTLGLTDLCVLELAWQATALGRVAVAQEASRMLPPYEGPAFRSRLIATYGRLADRAVTRPLLDELAQLRARRIAAIPDNWYQNLYAADIELAIAATAEQLGDHARATGAAQQAVQHLETFIAVTGVRAGFVERRLLWARSYSS